MDHIMAKGASKCLFLFFLSVLIVCNSFKSSAIPSAKVVHKFKDKISSSLPAKDFERRKLKGEEEQKFRSTHRGLLYKTTEYDSINPPTTTLPTTPITNPVTTPAVTFPPANPAPVIVTIPGTNPVTVPPNPTATPVTIPSSTPVPVNPPLPITNPVTTPSTFPGAQPTTNPVTVYPPPAMGSSPTVQGQSWCIAKNGASENAIQAALDYACGIGGADCSTIQQGASCYNPNTLQNHASFAFNSYYQKNPVQTSCDFGGSAVISNINPSTGSCVYPSSSMASSSSSPTTVNPTPTPTTTSSSWGALPGSVSPPPVVNSGNPDLGTSTGFSGSPPIANTTASSMSTGLQPFVGCLVLLTCITTGRFILDP